MVLGPAKSDWVETLRRWLVPPLGVIVQFINEVGGLDLYATGNSYSDEFVGRVSMDEESFEAELQSMGFERNPLASLKRLSNTGEVEEGSFRWVPPETSEKNHSKQLHVILYDGSKLPDADTGYIYVYSHWEYRWDWYPFRHYAGDEMNVDKGVELMRNKLDTYGIEYDDVRPSVE